MTVAANIPKYFLYIALKGFGFGLFISVWVIYLQERRGLSLSQAALVDATFFVAAAFGEIPTGIVADVLGRKASLTIGAILLTVAIICWTFAPIVPLIMLAYVAMGIGFTFQSGAEDALFYESIKLSGREAEYTHLVGRVGATFPGAFAAGSVVGGGLASLDLVYPYIFSFFIMLLMVITALSLTEPHAPTTSETQPRLTFKQILSQSWAVMKAKPSVRYPMIYLAIVPMAALMIETIFLQPQALKLGVPIAGIGLVVMAIQLVNMAGSSYAHELKTRFGEKFMLYITPIVLITGLLFLATFQVLPALAVVGVMSFFNATLRPLVLGRIQNEVADNIRATIISMQSFMFTVLGVVTQPSLGWVADKSGLPAAYIVLAGGLLLTMVGLFWMSRAYFPQSSPVQVSDKMVAEEMGV